MSITQLPPAPSRQDPVNFADEADLWVASLDQFTSEANALSSDVNAKQMAASASANTAANSAAAAAASAASAVNAPGTSGTSSTSLTIGAGNKTLTTQTSKNFVTGMWVNIARTSDVTQSMTGKIVSYNSGTGSLIVTIASGDIRGSGTYSDWTISQSGATGNILSQYDLTTLGPVIKPSLLLDFANAKRLPVGAYYTMASPQTYFDATGILRTAPQGVPAFNHDTLTGECLGLQMFQGSTNLFIRSEEFDNASWSKNAVSVVPDNTESPTSDISADRLVEDNTTNTHFVAQSLGTVSVGAVYTISAFVKAFDRTQIWLTSFNEGASIFNISNGTIADSGGNICTITPVRNGWYLCSATITKTNSTGSFFIGIYAGGLNYAGNGTSGLYVWGAQLEAMSTATPYIQTTSATVTRSAPQAYIDIADTWFNRIEGTLYAAAEKQRGSNEGGLCTLYGGSLNDRITVSQISSSLLGGINVGGVSQASFSDTPVSKNHIALAYKANDVAFSVNGSAAQTDVSASIPTVTRLYIGEVNGGGVLLPNGCISKVAYYPKRLSNAELSSVTQL